MIRHALASGAFGDNDPHIASLKRLERFLEYEGMSGAILDYPFEASCDFYGADDVAMTGETNTVARRSELRNGRNCVQFKGALLTILADHVDECHRAGLDFSPTIDGTAFAALAESLARAPDLVDAAGENELIMELSGNDAEAVSGEVFQEALRRAKTASPLPSTGQGTSALETAAFRLRYPERLIHKLGDEAAGDAITYESSLVATTFVTERERVVSVVKPSGPPDPGSPEELVSYEQTFELEWDPSIVTEEEVREIARSFADRIGAAAVRPPEAARRPLARPTDDGYAFFTVVDSEVARLLGRHPEIAGGLPRSVAALIGN